MALDLKYLIIIIAYAIISNLVLLEFANLGIGITCSEIPTETSNYTMNYSDIENENDPAYQSTKAGILDMAFGRCDGLPAWAYWLFEAPVVFGLLYIIRAFVGFT